MNVQSPKNSSLKDFQILQELGKGSFSTVYKVRRIADLQEYALKKVKLGSLKQREKENALNEVRLLASLDNRYVVGYKEAFLDDDSQCLCIVMELLSGGDVQKRISQALKGGPAFTESELWKALIHMTRGLKALHDRMVVHRDLKSANVFLANDGTFKLGDLNVSKVAKQGLVYTQTGTPYYASPEVWRDEPYDMKSDIWSLGCVLYEMACLKTPFRASEMEQLFRKVQKGSYDPVPAKYSKDLAQIIGSMLQVKPSLRLTCEQILNNPIVQKHTNDQEQLQITDNEVQKKQLLKTIQLQRNYNQLRSQLPKAKYDNETLTKSVERLNERSTENSPSPFNSPQPRIEPRISQSQVASRVPSDITKNHSAFDKGQKHHLLLHPPREVTPAQKNERPASTRVPVNQRPSLSPNQNQKSHSPINQDRRSIPQHAPSNPVIAQNLRYQNQVSSQILNSVQTKPYVSQSLNQPISSAQILKTAEARVHPQSAIQPQSGLYPQSAIHPSAGHLHQAVLRYQQPVTPKDRQIGGPYPQMRSALPSEVKGDREMIYSTKMTKERQPAVPSPVVRSAIPYDIKEERQEVFPTKARVSNKPRTQPNEKRDFVAARPAGKPTRPLSSNQLGERMAKQEYQPQYNLITGNYNHYYPIDQYHRHASDQNLIRYQMRQPEYNRLASQQINARKY